MASRHTRHTGRPVTILDIRDGHQHHQHLAQRVHHQMPFPTSDFLACIVAIVGSTLHRLHALAIENRGTGLVMRQRHAPKPHLRSALLTIDRVPDAIRQVVEDRFSCRVYNHYGIAEMAWAALTGWRGMAIICMCQRSTTFRRTWRNAP